MVVNYILVMTAIAMDNPTWRGSLLGREVSSSSRVHDCIKFDSFLWWSFIAVIAKAWMVVGHLI